MTSQSVSKLLTAALALLVNTASASIYDRPLHFVYAIGGNTPLSNSDAELQQAFSQVKDNITAFCPFFLNVGPDDIPKFSSMLKWATDSSIAIFPAVGEPAVSGAALNTPTNREIAQGYYKMVPGKRIRLENLTGFYSMNATDVVSFIDFCIDTGFENIMLNPWPYSGGGKLATFPAHQVPYLQSSFQQVDPSTWEINPGVVSQLAAMQPPINVVVNYESPGPQQELTQMEDKNPGSSEKVFNTTIKQLDSFPAKDNLHWCPPFTQSYDPLNFKPPTWPYIAEQLSKFQS